MKKWICVLAALMLVMTAMTALAEGADHLARIQAAGKIVAATEGNWAPWTRSSSARCSP